MFPAGAAAAAKWVIDCAMRSRTPNDFQGMCSRCYLKSAHCICHVLPVVPTRTEVLIIRHVTEQHVMSNTGRLAALLLPNCRIVNFTTEASFDDSGIAEDGTWLLYPGPNPMPRGPAAKRLVVLDASFRRAKRMYKRIDALQRLPELALPVPSVVPRRLRQPPRADGMSTIEAIAAGLSLVEDRDLGQVLLEVYAEFVRRADAAHGRVRQALP
jgi:DTW domain-containing protein